jgi:hypothetical protein
MYMNSLSKTMIVEKNKYHLICDILAR